MENDIYIVKGKIFSEYPAAKAFARMMGLFDGFSGGHGYEPEISIAEEGPSFEETINELLTAINHWPKEARDEYIAKLEDDIANKEM